MMKWWMAVAIMITAVRIAHADEVGHPLTIDLQMTNAAQVPTQVLEKSQDELTRIFDGAGLAVRWTETAPRFTVKIVAQVLGFDRAASPVMGVAQRTPKAAVVQVFFKQVKAFARTYDVDLSTILAYVIAHEIGHLLLGTAHPATGVMQAEWDRAVVHDAAKRSLTFTEAQAARIRASR